MSNIMYLFRNDITTERLCALIDEIGLEGLDVVASVQGGRESVLVCRKRQGGDIGAVLSEVMSSLQGLESEVQGDIALRIGDSVERLREVIARLAE